MYRRAHCSSTVGEALEALTLFQRLNSQSGAAYLLRQGSTTTLGFAVFQPHLGELAVVHDVALASLVASIRSFLGKDNWGPDEVLLPRSRPNEDRPYRAYFRRRVHFDAERACIRFPSHLMALPMASPDPVGARELETEGLRRLREALLPRLYRSLRLLLLDGAVTGDGIAQHLAMHRRTLDRRLRELGTSFQAVLDEVRFDIARQLLAETQLTVATIASSIGYSESSSLVHAFQRWSGTSPMKWRLLQQAAHAPSQPRADG
jgi:AraC-like DNA-binding protein